MSVSAWRRVHVPTWGRGGAGDFWHARGALPVEPLNAVLQEIRRWDFPTIMLVGNHDQVTCPTGPSTGAQHVHTRSQPTDAVKHVSAQPRSHRHALPWGLASTFAVHRSVPAPKSAAAGPKTQLCTESQVQCTLVAHCGSTALDCVSGAYANSPDRHQIHNKQRAGPAFPAAHMTPYDPS
jgi:hypothetical protein